MLRRFEWQFKQCDESNLNYRRRQRYLLLSKAMAKDGFDRQKTLQLGIFNAVDYLCRITPSNSRDPL
jgi:hypothetical protein